MCCVHVRDTTSLLLVHVCHNNNISTSYLHFAIETSDQFKSTHAVIDNQLRYIDCMHECMKGLYNWKCDIHILLQNIQ